MRLDWGGSSRAPSPPARGAVGDGRPAPRATLVVGAPRSGTTWVAEVLSRAPGVRWVNEPDNWAADPYARVGTRGLGRYPVMRAGERAPRYAAMWDVAFRGGWPSRRLTAPVWAVAARLPSRAGAGLLHVMARAAALRPRREAVLVKSVHSILALDWLAGRYEPVVVVVRSRPLNIVSSWVSLGWDGAPGVGERLAELRPAAAARARPHVRTLAGRAALVVALLILALDEAVERHPGWTVVDHEALCADPVTGFEVLCGRAGLPWTPAMAAHLGDLDRPGEGLVQHRVSAAQPQRWRRLTAAQLDEVCAVLAAAGLEPLGDAGAGTDRSGAAAV